MPLSHAEVVSHARDVAVDAAVKAGALLRYRQSLTRQVEHKGIIDIVTDADVRSEQLVRQTILAAFPGHTILGEEGGSVAGNEAGYRWIVDPLDGTTNYAHGFPFFCVSIGLEIDGEMAVGAIYDPNLDELFSAVRGQGAWLNGRPMRVSDRDDLSDCLLATGFPYERERFPAALRTFEAFSLRTMAVRRAGSAALDLAYVACGRFDAYWELVVRPWDVAAGSLIVTEAGGIATKLDGFTFNSMCGEVLASNGSVHTEMVAVLRSTGVC